MSSGVAVPPADAQVHLGPYAPLIGAIREELEQFVTNQLRLHLAIAERDRYVLSSIEVECESGEHERDLLRRFTREFRPEQVKHYLAKEIIAGLRNASAIDLSQFAGLNAEREEPGASREQERYGDLIAELASGAPPTVARPYRVTLVGRWSEATPASAGVRTGALDGPRTPLAARPIAVDIEDAAGARHVELAVVAGHRYAIGKGEAATSSSTARSRVAAIAKYGSTRVRGGWPTPARPTASASSPPTARRRTRRQIRAALRGSRR
jgi:hypothetical protein